VNAVDRWRTQAVAIADQDHSRVPMAVSTMLARGLDQLLDLALGEIAAFDCEVLVLGVLALAVCFAMRKALRVSKTVTIITLFFTVVN
jgi:hypothetical protein